MDELFRDIVQYHRRVLADGGFWFVEDDLVDLEEQIRRDLSDWMELFDEKKEKFFFNRRTDESRFDDPRMVVYHNLYARIKMIARMKEKYPLLARAPRPEAPTAAELERQRRKDEELREEIRKVIKIQAAFRAMLARVRVKHLRAQATRILGQPLKGSLRLRLEKVGPSATKELVLSQTTPHKRNRAATKIQATFRGYMTRKRMRPIIRHRRFLSKLMTSVQRQARVFLAVRCVERKREERLTKAVVTIQRVWRGHVDRDYVAKLRTQKERYDFVIRAVVKIQGLGRQLEAKRRVASVRASRTATS